MKRLSTEQTIALGRQALNLARLGSIPTDIRFNLNSVYDRNNTFGSKGQLSCPFFPLVGFSLAIEKRCLHAPRQPEARTIR